MLKKLSKNGSRTNIVPCLLIMKLTPSLSKFKEKIKLCYCDICPCSLCKIYVISDGLHNLHTSKLAHDINCF